MKLGAGMGVGCARKVQASQITTVTPPLLLRENPKFSSMQLFPQNTCAISAASSDYAHGPTAPYNSWCLLQKEEEGEQQQ